MGKDIDDILKFMKAEDEAFKKAGIKYGEVEFTCPICGGKAWAARYRTSKNIAHKITVRGGCEGCGMRYMN